MDHSGPQTGPARHEFLRRQKLAVTSQLTPKVAVQSGSLLSRVIHDPIECIFWHFYGISVWNEPGHLLEFNVGLFIKHYFDGNVIIYLLLFAMNTIY